MENNPRIIALDAICSVVLDKKSLSNFVYPQQDNALVKSLVFGTIRFYHQLNDIVSKLLDHSLKKQDLDIHCLMLLGAYQILYSNVATHASVFETVNVTVDIDKSWAKGLVNAILRQIDRNKEKLLAQTHYSHPTWMVKKIKQNYPNDFEQILEQNNIQAPMTIRVHPKTSTADYQQQLSDLDITSQTLEVAPQALVLDKPMSVYALPDFETGSCYVQDGSPQLFAPLLDPKEGDLVLDACSAPGGKTTHLSELAPKAKIIALDSDKDRLERVAQNAQRFNINNIEIIRGDAQEQDWWDKKHFDKILLDAPCSATGVIRRHPDIKLLRKPKDITALVELQSKILDNLWQMLKPGGTLLYATCSILKAENEFQIADFLYSHDDAREIKIDLDWGVKTVIGKQQLPSPNFDGFYYAKLSKIS
ncbi:16S rRNA (cytosine(967)-C(5))-methyltransferase [Bathymodiolus heckerae thiotrophic gill symbiont]|uniref:16S rRNA (cytosine(967)-C(5))-methyltransferase RsmB n=1 Tax=Bathymodiolus heckerae thiotrophic gill symbiont TaxID=1052212 RepID=UPI0010BACAFF|nr:16S rRNA (cytosine(967)-C(5))-methyltransferase RsmB [Bathymodiolus heckerae thiotrophic gill symbiont]SHN89791.1 16S rRNA (cytosine(967)-C(5))-methyltransferase [Bathymodiolus heckerae thiotrophic gill symbiont]